MSTQPVFHARPSIVATEVPREDHLRLLPCLFGPDMLRFERFICFWSERLCPHCGDSDWRLIGLSNGGCYMAPDAHSVHVQVERNGFDAIVSADGAGIIVSLYALELLAESVCNERVPSLYEHLREFAVRHPESSAIHEAISACPPLARALRRQPALLAAVETLRRKLCRRF